MIYIETDGIKYPIEKFQVFKTQFGNDGIRIYGEVPITDGFRIYADDELIADKSDFKYLYREDDVCKEYTKVEETPIPTESYAMGDVPVNPIQRQISALNKRISDITPYTQTKYGYYGETEKVFYNVPNGNVTVFCDVDNSITRIEDRLIVKFAEKLTDTVEITIMVQ